MRSRGFALVIVLWTLVLLSFVMTHMIAAGRTETRIAANFVANADAETQADGAVLETVFRIMDMSDAHWDVGDGQHVLRMNQAKAAIAIVSEDGKVNPNSASAQMLAALMVATGAKQAQAAALAKAMLDWRQTDDNNDKAAMERKLAQYRGARLDYGPPAAPFESLDEIGKVIGMTPDLLSRLKPNLSLFQNGEPQPAIATPAVAKALKSLAQPPVPPNADIQQTVSIYAQVTTDRGGHYRRHAVVRIDPPASQTYSVLLWDTEGAAN
jgi:general secretion pathway protein K